MAVRTLIVSATNVMARGYYVVPVDRKSEHGTPVNGLFALARGLLRAIAFKVPARAVAVIDTAAPFASWPKPLAEQLSMLEPLLVAFGLRVVRAPDELHLVASYTKA